jgi:hypothetical protein
MGMAEEGIADRATDAPRLEACILQTLRNPAHGFGGIELYRGRFIRLRRRHPQ